MRRRQDEIQSDLASRSISRSTRGSHSVATGPPPSPIMTPNSPGLSDDRPVQPGPSKQASIFFSHSPYNPTPPRPTGYEHLLPSGQPSPGGLQFSFPPVDSQHPWPQVYRRFKELEDGPADDEEDKAMFDSVIKQQEELEEIGLLLAQPGSSASNQNAAGAMTNNPPAPTGAATGAVTGAETAENSTGALAANPPNPTGAASGAENPEPANAPSGPDETAEATATRQTLPAISISPPGDESVNGDDMVVDGGSPRPLPVLVIERQEAPATEPLSEGMETNAD